MKHVVLTVAAFLVAISSVFAQKVILENERNLTPTFVDLQARGIKVEDANVTLRQILDMQADDDLVVIQQVTDELGMTHTRYQQYYQGIKVEYNTYLVHSKNGLLTAMNGEFERMSAISTTPSLTEDAAFTAALTAVNAKSYAWENAEGRSAYVEAMGHQPEKSELVIVNDWNNANGAHMAPRLAYKFTVHAEEPFSIDFVFIDAQNGKVLLRNPDVHHVEWTNAENPHAGCTHAHGHDHGAEVNLSNSNWAPLAATNVPTRYSGTQTIGTQSSSGTYRLYDNSRAASVHTKNANTSSSWSFSSASEITDSNNDWVETNSGSAYQLGALDAQWASGLTYDYFSSAHGRAGIDDNNLPMRNLVNAYSNWFNAQWSSSYQTMRYGMGSTGNNPLTTLDVGAHELVHGVTSSSSNLVYSYESGALNEGMSDCFAAAVELTYAPGKQPWKIGEELESSFIRSMDNPNEKSDPDTYGGTYWHTSSADNGGVHTNSAILNHFFYILVEGKSGTNDNGDAYNVAGLGLADAA
ncbi:MAG TPA: hypothetical protein DCP28_07080, partial [Cytophagales bacterium]|nr:hypothetical protein [Cytophagales bacterium]